MQYRIQNIKLSTKWHANNNTNNTRTRIMSTFVRHVRKIITRNIFLFYIYFSISISLYTFFFSLVMSHVINNTRVSWKWDSKPFFVVVVAFVAVVVGVYVRWNQEISAIIKLSKVCTHTVRSVPNNSSLVIVIQPANSHSYKHTLPNKQQQADRRREEKKEKRNVSKSVK